MRQVRCYKNVWVQNEDKIKTGRYEKQYTGLGWFHCFSIESEEIDGGSLHYPVALIELIDGSIESFGIGFIEFTQNPL